MRMKVYIVMDESECMGEAWQAVEKVFLDEKLANAFAEKDRNYRVVEWEVTQ